jgi:alpha-mannosidase
MTIRHGFDYNYKLLAMQVGSHAGSMPLEHSFVSIKGDNVVLTAIKKAEDTDALVLRFYEWAGKSGDIQLIVPKGATAATFTNLLETPEGRPLSLVDSERLVVPVTPYAIETVELAYSHKAKQPN